MLFIRLSHVISNPPIVELSSRGLGTQCVRAATGSKACDSTVSILPALRNR